MLQDVTPETLTFERWSWHIHVVALISQHSHLQYLTANVFLIAPAKKVEILLSGMIFGAIFDPLDR